MDLFGPLTNLCLDFGHLLSYAGPSRPVLRTPGQVLEPVWPPSLVLSETDRVVSVAPKQARGGEDLQICLICTTGFGLGTGLEGQLGQLSLSGLKSGDRDARLLNRPDNLRVCIRGKQWKWITAKPSHERQANAKSDDVRPVLPPEPVVEEGWTFGCRFGRSPFEARYMREAHSVANSTGL
jgi:hypothetical protein